MKRMVAPPLPPVRLTLSYVPLDRGLHSSTFRLNKGCLEGRGLGGISGGGSRGI